MLSIDDSAEPATCFFATTDDQVRRVDGGLDWDRYQADCVTTPPVIQPAKFPAEADRSGCAAYEMRQLPAEIETTEYVQSRNAAWRAFWHFRGRSELHSVA